MAAWRPFLAAAVFLLVSILAALVMISISSEAVGPTGVVEIEEDTYYISVSPEDPAEVQIDVSLRSTETRNSVFDLVYELDGPSAWSVELPEKVYLGPLEKKTFKAAVACPHGELAERTATLEIKAIPEGMGVSWDGEVSSDTCTIRVEPYLWASIEFQDDFLLDVPRTGEFGATIRNDGNTVSLIGARDEQENGLTIPPFRKIDPGDSVQLVIGYEIPVESDTFSVELTAVSGDWISLEAVELEFVREGNLYHLLFSRGPFLILTTSNIPREEPEVSLFSLGGGLENVGLEIVEGPEDARLRTERELDMGDLERETLLYQVSGLDRDALITIRAYGFSGGEKIVSNPAIVRARGEPADTFSVPVPVVAGGGAAAASIVIAGSAAYFYSASEVFKYRWLTLALVPLYSLVHDEKVLDHFFRGRLFEYIKEHPGVTFTALKDHFEVNNGTLTYHLHRLEREDLITYRNLGKYKMFYADGVRIRGCEVVISPMDKEIIELISERPGITTAQVISMLKGERSQRTISRHLKQLERKGFLEVERSHGARRLFITGEMERVLMPHRGVVEVVEMTGVQT
ncbi:MAG: helix-turn-helix domain-containing protein [Thermoplasmatota archaeon]